MMEPTVTQNSALYIVQHKVPKRRSEVLGFANNSSRRFEIARALMRIEEFWIPQIQNDPAALPIADCKPSQKIAVCCLVEVSKALAHNDDCVECVRCGLITAYVVNDV